jgi:membrane protein YqaA with SNARE-associated domain
VSDPNADFKTLLDLTGGVQVRSAEHPEDRRQRHRLEKSALWLIGAIAGFSALILLLSFVRPVPEKRADWAAGVLQLVLGGAVGFALKRPS